jgi:hypothetical protein
METQDYTITGLKVARENLVSQRSPAETLDIADVPAEHIFTTQGSLLRGRTCLHSTLLRSSIGDAAAPCE